MPDLTAPFTKLSRPVFVLLKTLSTDTGSDGV